VKTATTELSKQAIVTKFFDAYNLKDRDALKSVMSESITWIFPGSNPFIGTKKGISEVLRFFDNMGTVMNRSHAKTKPIISCENGNYFIECQQIQTDKIHEHGLDQPICVLWKFRNNKIVEGRHFFSDPAAADIFFNNIAGEI
jgi:ketosteroid isomerase-like protein